MCKNLIVTRMYQSSPPRPDPNRGIDPTGRITPIDLASRLNLSFLSNRNVTALSTEYKRAGAELLRFRSSMYDIANAPNSDTRDPAGVSRKEANYASLNFESFL
jgi:hypothetical protein